MRTSLNKCKKSIIIIIINTLSYYYTALSFGRFGWFGGGWCAAPFGFSLSAATSPMPLSSSFSLRGGLLRLHTSFDKWCIYGLGRSCSLGSSSSFPLTLIEPPISPQIVIAIKTAFFIGFPVAVNQP